uniref:Uncharacterized protein n=1 Tax=Graphocephala atropunctata TaxID=36148 RepID=A0A1B6LBW2_9HEMI
MSNWSSFSNQSSQGGYQRPLSNLFDLEPQVQGRGFSSYRGQPKPFENRSSPGHRDERHFHHEQQRQVQGSFTSLFDIPSGDTFQQRNPVNTFDPIQPDGFQGSDFSGKESWKNNRPRYNETYQDSYRSRESNFIPNRFEPRQGSLHRDSRGMTQQRGPESSSFDRGQSRGRPWRGRGYSRGGFDSQSRGNFKQSVQGNKVNKSQGFPQDTQNKKVFDFVGDNKQEQNFKTKDTHEQQEPSLKMEHLEESNEEMREEFEEDEEDTDDDEEEEETETETCDTSNFITPDPAVVEKYKLYPPTPEELGKLVEGLTLYFFYKVKNSPEKNPFVIVCESFRRSNRFGNLEVNDGIQKGDKFVKFCTLRWKGIMMARGVGESGNMKEPRVRAGVDLINRLAMTCYSLQMKDEYYSSLALEKHLADEECPGVFKVVPPDDIKNPEEAKAYMNNFFSEDTDCELIFSKYIHDIKWYAKKHDLDVRLPKSTHVAVCKKRTPSYWRDKILASGSMENEKYFLAKPTGIGNELLKGFDISIVIPKMKKKGVFPRGNVPEIQLYGPNTHIVNVTVPWEKKSARGMEGRRFAPSKNNRKKERKIEEKLQQGLDLSEIKEFRYMSRKAKQRVKKMYGINSKPQ